MKRVLLLLLALSLLATGCSARLPAEKEASDLPLPTVRLRYEPPTGDNQTGRVTSAVLYMPNLNATRLDAKEAEIPVSSGQSIEEAMVRVLLEQVNTSGYVPESQPLMLGPGSNPVEVTGELITVNLHRNAGRLTTEKLFALQVAITNTLTELPGTKYVNVLVDGKDQGFAYSTLPTGVFASYPSGDISTLWGQIEAQRETADLSKAVSLFFPSQDGRLLLGEVRNIAFPDRSNATYARVLLEELAKGPQQAVGAARVVPDAAYYEEDPYFDDVERVIYVYFLQAVDDWLLLRGFTRGMLFSSICYTLSGFMPALKGVKIYVEENLVTEMDLMDGSVLNMPGGLMEREQFSPLVGDPTVIYFPLADGSGLASVMRPLEQRNRTQARALLRELMNPPEDAKFTAALPTGIGDADILGLQILDDTVLINFTRAFAQACRGMTAVQERDMVYAIVNTLTELDGVRRVRFFVDGAQEQLAGTLFMGGEFLRHAGLIRK